MVASNHLLIRVGPVPGGWDGKASAYNAGDPDSIPGSGRSPAEGNSNPLQYSCLENPVDRGAWEATVHGVANRHDWATSHMVFINNIVHRSCCASIKNSAQQWKLTDSSPVCLCEGIETSSWAKEVMVGKQQWFHSWFKTNKANVLWAYRGIKRLNNRGMMIRKVWTCLFCRGWGDSTTTTQ